MKYRAETRTREVPHTEDDGDPVLIPDDYTVHVPVPPRDWDHIVLNAVTGGAIILNAVSVVWSTVSGGALLSRAAPAWVAYPAAVPFEAGWMTCLALEWLARHDPERARVPRRAGYVALAIAMTVIYVHGATTPAAGLWVGAAGAVISAIAKGVWTLVLRHTAAPLPPRTQAWLKVKRGQGAARLALAAQRRELLRMDDQYDALVASGLGRGETPVLLSRTEPDTGTESVPARPAPQDNVPPNPTREQPREDTANPVVPLSPGETLTDAVRAAIKDGVQDKYAALQHVMAAHGDGVNGASVMRIYNRLTNKARRTG
ncbi:protein transporter Sec31 [Streptomyces kronopolitis]|uniref:protein transporter Sec31 n=1 Tax=Streptomyces kronopolitis TaxID=1612435 RepID=UPI00343B8326